jgi:hypothetical protein
MRAWRSEYYQKAVEHIAYALSVVLFVIGSTDPHHAGSFMMFISFFGTVILIPWAMWRYV